MICYEDGKFPVIDAMVSCVLLSYLFILMISYLSYSIVIFYEGGGQFSVINKLVSCVPLSYLSFFMISDLTYFTVICHEARKFLVIDTLDFVCL